MKIARIATLLLRVCLCGLVPLPELLLAHSVDEHQDKGVDVDSAALDEPNSSLPMDIGGPFSLIDHHGEAVTDTTYAGKHMLVFFSYTDCQFMCSVSLRNIGSAMTLLEDENTNLLGMLAPLVVTVNPKTDTPARLKQALAQYHPALVGLTGTPENLESMYKAFNQSPVRHDEPMGGKDVVTHTSMFHLLGPDGEFQTLFPPILSGESMAKILRKYLR